MGLWGAICSVGRAVGGAVKSAVHAVVDTAKKVVNSVKEGVTNVWNKFTGKRIFDEAEKLYEKIAARYNERRKIFEAELEEYTKRIEKHVARINQSKEKIKRELFREMAKKMEKIKDISIAQDFSVEEYKAAALSFDQMRAKSELYKIDFNGHEFKTALQAIFTLGFYTRKKARETLYAVQEEEAKVETEISKMDAEIVKIKAIEQSLDNVVCYFDALIPLYENLLVRLDNSVNFLYVRCMSVAHKLVHREMSLKRLPVMQQKEVEAIITASKILKAMTDAQIVSIENGEKMDVYSQEMEQQYYAVKTAYEAA